MRKAAVPIIRRATAHRKDEGRFYTVEGQSEPFPSVTTVLDVINKPKLHLWTKTRMLSFIRTRLNFLRQESTTGTVELTEEWVEQTVKEAAERPDVEASIAAQFGTTSHSIIENVIKGQEQAVDPKYAMVLANYNSWLAQSDLEIKETEKFVWSEKHRYAGSLDAWGLCTHRDGRQRLVVVDWKTTNYIQPQYALQVAAYAKALGEMTGTPVDEGWVIRLDKTKPNWQAKKVADLDHTFEDFLGALRLWRSLKADPYAKLSSSSGRE